MQTWSAHTDPERLAQIVRGVCGISQETSEELVAELSLSSRTNAVVNFDTRNELLGHPIKSEVVHHWRIVRHHGPTNTTWKLEKTG